MYLCCHGLGSFIVHPVELCKPVKQSEKVRIVFAIGPEKFLFSNCNERRQTERVSYALGNRESDSVFVCVCVC